MTSERERIKGVLEHVVASKNAFVEAMKDPGFRKAADEMHDAYVEMLRGDTPKDWVYRCDWTSEEAFNQMVDFLGHEMHTAVLTIRPSMTTAGEKFTGVHFTVFISPTGIDMLKQLKAKHVVQ